jgi:hypothetical protein
MPSINRIADLAQLYQEAGRFDDASTLRDYISRHGGDVSPVGKTAQHYSSQRTLHQPGDVTPFCKTAHCGDGPESAGTRLAEKPIVGTRWQVAQSIAIAAYIFSLCLMLLPSWPPRDLLIQPVQPFLGAFGLWQAWNVFSPEIRKENYHLLAFVDFKDGSMSVWEFPRQEEKTGIEQLRAHRFRKWSQDRVKNNTFGLVMPDTARYVARIHNNKLNPPVAITISMLAANIPEPRIGKQDPLPPHVNKTTLFTYKVVEGDLK